MIFNISVSAQVANNHDASLQPRTAIQYFRPVETNLFAGEGLNHPIALNVVVTEDIIDACINNERAVINRLAEQKGEQLFFYIKNGKAEFKDVEIFERIKMETGIRQSPVFT